MRFAALRRIFAAALATIALAVLSPAGAATPAEDLVSNNIQRGFDILNDAHLTTDQRRTAFADFLLGVTDLKRVSAFMLGTYGGKASQADRDAFATAFQRYAVAVYQSYFERYAGQTLKVTGSRVNGPADDIVATRMMDPGEPSATPLEVDFRVRSDAGKPVIVDFSVGGMWLAPAERDQFVAFLNRNGGDIPALIAYMDRLRAGIASSR